MNSFSSCLFWRAQGKQRKVDQKKNKRNEKKQRKEDKRKQKEVKKAKKLKAADKKVKEDADTSIRRSGRIRQKKVER